MYYNWFYHMLYCDVIKNDTIGGLSFSIHFWLLKSIGIGTRGLTHAMQPHAIQLCDLAIDKRCSEGGVD